jgi:tetratricopeptide (TPR) repeat protein
VALVAAAVFVVLVIAAGTVSLRSYQQQKQLAEVAALVDRYSSARASGPGGKDDLTLAITAIAEGAATDPRYAKALELLKAGRPIDAEPLLKSVAEDKTRRAEKDAKDAAAAYRNLASISAVSDPKRAREYYAEARLDPSNIFGMFQNGWFQQDAGNLDAAQSAYARVIASAKPGNDDHTLLLAQLLTGDIKARRAILARRSPIIRKQKP